MTTEPEREFHEVVARVEERWRPEFSAETAARLGAILGSGGGSEGKYDQLLGAYGRHYPRADIDKVLNELYPQPPTNPKEEP